MLKDAVLSTVDGVEISLTGEQLNQDDHDVLIQLVHMARHKPLGESVTIPAYAILKALNRTTGGKDHKQLQAEIDRLVSGRVKIKNRKTRLTYYGHLIEAAMQDETSRHWVYRLNPDLAPFYSVASYTLIDWEQRLQLKRKDLARWLHLWLVGHAEPYPVKVDYIREKCGSRAATLKKFREGLRRALKDLEAEEIISKGWIDPDTDLMHIERGATITASQQRRLGRKNSEKIGTGFEGR